MQEKEKDTSSVNDVSDDFPGVIEGEKLIRDYLDSKGAQTYYWEDVYPTLTEGYNGRVVRTNDNKSLVIEIGDYNKSAQIVYHADSDSKWSWSIYFRSNYYDFDIFEALDALTQNCSTTSKPPITYLKQRLAEAGDDAFNWDHAIEVTYMGKRYKMCNDADGIKSIMIMVEPIN